MRSKRNKWSIFDLTDPIPFLNEQNQISDLPEQDLKQTLDFEYINHYKEAFELRDPEALSNYYVILKAKYEILDTWDNGITQLIVALGVAAFSSVVAFLYGQHTKDINNIAVSIGLGLSIGLAILLIILFLAPKIGQVARKKAKVMLFLTLIEETFRGNKNAD